MSGMGWFTESTILPKQSRKIVIDDSSLVSCKAVLSQMKQKMKEKKNEQQIGKKQKVDNKKQIKQNKGIQDRIKRDEQQNRIGSYEQSYADVRNKLIKKEQTYGVMKKSERNHSQFLTDFSIKPLLEIDQEFQQLKKQFYEGKLDDVIKQQDQLHNQQKGIEQDLRERLTWQRQVLDQLKGGDIIEEKEKVAQSFNRKLTNQQKQALQKVLQQKLVQKKRFQEIRKRRIMEQQERIRKLIKMSAYQQPEEDDNDNQPQKKKERQSQKQMPQQKNQIKQNK